MLVIVIHSKLMLSNTESGLVAVELVAVADAAGMIQKPNQMMNSVKVQLQGKS